MGFRARGGWRAHSRKPPPSWAWGPEQGGGHRAWPWASWEGHPVLPAGVGPGWPQGKEDLGGGGAVLSLPYQLCPGPRGELSGGRLGAGGGGG